LFLRLSLSAIFLRNGGKPYVETDVVLHTPSTLSCSGSSSGTTTPSLTRLPQARRRHLPQAIPRKGLPYVQAAFHHHIAICFPTTLPHPLPRKPAGASPGNISPSGIPTIIFIITPPKSNHLTLTSSNGLTHITLFYTLGGRTVRVPADNLTCFHKYALRVKMAAEKIFASFFNLTWLPS